MCSIVFSGLPSAGLALVERRDYRARGSAEEAHGSTREGDRRVSSVDRSL
jgi:hypothetical protein